MEEVEEGAGGGGFVKFQRLPPTLRERKRYLVFEVRSEWRGEREEEKREVLREIWNSVYSLHGEVGASESNIWLINYAAGVGILRCAHNRVEEVRAALACVHSLNDAAKVGIRVLGVSGTIKGAKRLAHLSISM
ncbi:ribonuclease P [ANME-1 cluster archaeon ex4572_4]|nr:MAG: ribonuclease P [ANME-1 cluster archaeon ex4572_4]RLF92643.1 MAG: ribonuclease P [Thermococci archaeon]HDN68392.1 ribonuclease P [Methanomicrobia archaeon]